jgi:hypothetical protein
MKETADYLRQTIAFLRPHLESISDEDASVKPAPNKWSKKEIVGHLIDSACNNQQKFVRTMAQPHLAFVGYAQDFWVDVQRYNAYDWKNLIGLWYVYNEHIAHIIEHVSPEKLPNTISIEDSQPFTLQFIMQDYVEHIKHHMKVVLPNVPIESKFENVYGA